MGYKFFAEARRLWDEARHKKSHITTVQAGFVINILYSMDSMDKLGMTYAVQALAIAHDLDIFGYPRQTWSRRKKHAYGFTAWCLYSYLSILCFHLMIPSPIKEIPKSAVPEIDENPEWYGEFYLQYPLTQALSRMDYGRSLKVRTEMSIIVNDLGHYLFDNANGAKRSFKTLVTFARKLLAWYSELPIELAPKYIVFPAQLKVHQLYHDTLINVCEGILSSQGQSEYTPPLHNIPKIIESSKVSLETVLRLYYSRHGFDRSDIHMTHFMHVLATISLRRLQTLRESDSTTSSTELEEVQSTLVLAAKGLHDQGWNYYLPYIIFHVICDDMGPAESNIMYQYTDIRKEDLATSRLRAKHVQSQYPIKILNVTEDPEQQRLDDLVSRYANLALEVSGSDESEIEDSS
ncbi:hypothetical protein N0V90_006021 [Kalmusia sp. IMI 367209]|nr:hypothetical protein N0V90_006021 [Kalmusia sp. IMI 367209]